MLNLHLCTPLWPDFYHFVKYSNVFMIFAMNVKYDLIKTCMYFSKGFLCGPSMTSWSIYSLSSFGLINPLLCNKVEQIHKRVYIDQDVIGGPHCRYFYNRLWYLDKILDNGHSDTGLWLLSKMWVQVGLTQKSPALYKKSAILKCYHSKPNNCSRTNKSISFQFVEISFINLLVYSHFLSKSGETFYPNNSSILTTHSLSRINMSLVRFLW